MGTKVSKILSVCGKGGFGWKVQVGIAGSGGKKRMTRKKYKVLEAERGGWISKYRNFLSMCGKRGMVVTKV